MANDNPVIESIKRFILDEFLQGEDPAALAPATPLLTSGILDSIATLKLIAFLEQEYGIRVEPHEVDAEHLNTLQSISQLVESKR
jgi:acyl carrier protein